MAATVTLLKYVVWQGHSLGCLYQYASGEHFLTILNAKQSLGATCDYKSGPVFPIFLNEVREATPEDFEIFGVSIYPDFYNYNKPTTKKMTNASSPLLQMISDRIRSEKVNSLLTNGILIALDRPDSGPDIIAACVAGLVDNFPDVSKILGEEITAEIVGLPEFKIGLMIESAANKYSTAVGANDETRIWKSFFDFKAGVSWAGQNLFPRWIDAAKSTPLRFDIEIAVTMIHENDASGDRPTKAFTKYSAATGWDVAAGWTVITWLYDIDHL